MTTDGAAAKSFAIFTYQCTCTSLQWPDTEATVTIGFQGEADFFAIYNPLSDQNEIEASGSEPGCENGSTAVNWCNLVYQLAPKPPGDASKYCIMS